MAFDKKKQVKMLLLARYFTIFAFTKISPGENKPIKIKKKAKQREGKCKTQAIDEI